MTIDNNTIRDRIRGCIVGGAAGDALGYPVEFDRFRERLRDACPDCKNRELCKGGCPLHPLIVFCNREERTTGRKPE